MECRIALFKKEEELREIIENYNDINSKLVGDKRGKPYKKSALNLFKYEFKRFVKKFNNMYYYNKRCTYNLIEKAVESNNTAIVEYLLRENISPVMMYYDFSYDKVRETTFSDIPYAVDKTTSLEMKQLLAGSTLDKLDEYDKICNSIKDFNMKNRRVNLKYDNKEQLKIELRQILELNFDMVENFEREENIELNYDLAEVFPDINFKEEKETFCSIC